MKPNFKEEKILWAQGFECVAGLDEAGRGSLAGPVVAAAAMMDSKFEYRNSKQIQITKIQNQKHVSNFVLRISDLKIRDSKKMTPKARAEAYKIITKHQSIKWGIGIVSEKVIDEINILAATKLAMQEAVLDLGIKPEFLILDGNFFINSKIPQKPIIKADEKVFSCVAAGIIAKVTRDRIMKKMHKKYPQYGFGKHKGYGTELHVKMLEKYGACPIHRKSFSPVAGLF